MTENLVTAYMNYYLQMSDDNSLDVILIHPKAFIMLRDEGVEPKLKDGYYYIDLCGNETPLIIRHDMPDEMAFQIMKLENYRRLENE